MFITWLKLKNWENFRAVDISLRESTYFCGITFNSGVPGGIRTPDPQLRRLLLYPAELRAHKESG